MAVIKSGNSGDVASVDSKKRLVVFATSQDLDKALNREGNIFSTYFVVTPVGANDYFVYIENTGAQDIVIIDIAISSSVITEITYDSVSGTPVFVSATDGTVINNNLGSSEELSVDIKIDTDITALAVAGVISFEECGTVNTRFRSELNAGIIVPQGKAVAFKRVAATGEITCNIRIGIVDI